MSKVSKINSISTTEFKTIVESCFSIREIVEKMGFSRQSGSMAIKVKERIAKEQIDTSHFLGRLSVKGKHIRIEMEDILVKDSTYTNIYMLKKRLVNDKLLKYECQLCKNDGTWNGQKLTLQLDHINGDHKDHRLVNLRFLCPNCHSQTETFSGRNVKKYPEVITLVGRPPIIQ